MTATQAAPATHAEIVAANARLNIVFLSKGAMVGSSSRRSGHGVNAAVPPPEVRAAQPADGGERFHAARPDGRQRLLPAKDARSAPSTFDDWLAGLTPDE